MVDRRLCGQIDWLQVQHPVQPAARDVEALLATLGTGEVARLTRIADVSPMGEGVIV